MLVCPDCQSIHIVKNGKSKAGVQTFLCKTCGRRFHPEAKPVAHSETTRQQVMAALNERMSLRGVERVFGIHRNTVIKWVKKGLNN